MDFIQNILNIFNIFYTPEANIVTPETNIVTPETNIVKATKYVTSDPKYATRDQYKNIETGKVYPSYDNGDFQKFIAKYGGKMPLPTIIFIFLKLVLIMDLIDDNNVYEFNLSFLEIINLDDADINLDDADNLKFILHIKELHSWRDYIWKIRPNTFPFLTYDNLSMFCGTPGGIGQRSLTFMFYNIDFDKLKAEKNKTFAYAIGDCLISLITGGWVKNGISQVRFMEFKELDWAPEIVILADEEIIPKEIQKLIYSLMDCSYEKRLNYDKLSEFARNTLGEFANLIDIMDGIEKAPEVYIAILEFINELPPLLR